MLKKSLIGLFILLTISLFITRMKNAVEEERYYLAKIVGDNDVSTVVLAKSNRSINLEEASGHFLDSFVAACGGCQVLEKGYIENVPAEYLGTFDNTNNALDYTLVSSNAIAFVVVDYEGGDNVSLYNCKKRRANLPAGAPLKISCIGSQT